MPTPKLIKELKGFMMILPFALIVFLVYCGVEWFNFNNILDSQKRFTLEATILFADAYLINVVSLMLLPGLLFGERIKTNLSKVILNSINQMPKVLLSYFLLMALTQFSFEVSQSSPIPALIVLVLFIWAPYFVSLEQFAEQKLDDEIKIEDEDFDSIDPFDDAVFVEKPKTLFSNKPAWRMGFSRSLEFTSKNTALSLSVVFVIWLVRVVPELLIGLTMDVNSNFNAVLLQVAATCLGAVFLNMFILSALFRGLEPAQRTELVHTFGDEYKDKQLPFIITSPNGIRISILCLLVIFTAAIWSEKRIQVNSFPSDLSFKIEDYQDRQDEVVFKIEIKDEASKLRWLNPNRFRFYVVGSDDKKDKGKEEKAPENKQQEDPKNNETFQALIKMLNEKLVPPSRVVIYNSENKIIPIDQVSPRNEALKIVMAFPLKANLKGSNNSLYEFSYLNPFGLKQVLLTFSKESGVSLIGRDIKQ